MRPFGGLVLSLCLVGCGSPSDVGARAAADTITCTSPLATVTTVSCPNECGDANVEVCLYPAGLLVTVANGALMNQAIIDQACNSRSGCSYAYCSLANVELCGLQCVPDTNGGTCPPPMIAPTAVTDTAVAPVPSP